MTQKSCRITWQQWSRGGQARSRVRTRSPGNSEDSGEGSGEEDSGGPAKEEQAGEELSACQLEGTRASTEALPDDYTFRQLSIDPLVYG